MEHEAVLEKLRREVTVEEYDAVRSLWKQHSKAEDARDLDGLIATLVPDCVYELVQSGHRWEGHDGARQFYTGLLTAFPDIVFDLNDIVIGPQGVVEQAHVSATHARSWLGSEPAGEAIEFDVVIFFPWDPGRRLFLGERVWTHADEGMGVPIQTAR